MVVFKAGEQLDSVFAALSDPTRRQILLRLRDGAEVSASRLAEPFPMSLPGVTKHLSALEKAGLVHQHKAGRQRLYRLSSEPLREAGQWIGDYESFWNTHLDALNNYVKGRSRHEA
jgi:DNA-binding transcriptional ArsR family regulator